MKRILFLVFFLAFSFSLFAQSGNNIDDSSFEDLDSLFEDAADLEEAVQSATLETETTNESKPAAAAPSPYYGIRLNGNLEAAMGYGLAYSTITGFDQSGYLSFDNHFYAKSKPNDAVYIFADVRVFLMQANPGLQLYQIYFDYNLWNKVFITVGKKSIGWGQCRLFDSNTVLGGTLGSTILGSVRVPVKSANLTAVAMYGGTIKLPDADTIDINPIAGTGVNKADLHYAAQMEGILWNTLVAFNAHQYHPAKTTYSTRAGLDLKHTFFGYDCYTHTDTALKISSNMNKNSWSHVRTIAGFYRKWDSPNLGFNIEGRHIYTFASGKNTFEIGEQFGWNGFWGNRIAIAFVGYHNITAGTGYVTPGFVLKNVFPSANLNTGLTVDYTPQGVAFTLGTKLTLSVDY